MNQLSTNLTNAALQQSDLARRYMIAALITAWVIMYL
nr:MAG TPA: hypothetical protein [Caudoviricetes sp.]